MSFVYHRQIVRSRLCCQKPPGLHQQPCAEGTGVFLCYGLCTLLQGAHVQRRLARRVVNDAYSAAEVDILDGTVQNIADAEGQREAVL